MTISLNSFQYSISLTTNTIDLSGLIDAINSQLNGSPIRAREATGGVLELYQIQPYNGGVMTLSGGYAELLGLPSNNPRHGCDSIYRNALRSFWGGRFLGQDQRLPQQDCRAFFIP